MTMTYMIVDSEGEASICDGSGTIWVLASTASTAYKYDSIIPSLNQASDQRCSLNKAERGSV